MAGVFYSARLQVLTAAEHAPKKSRIPQQAQSPTKSSLRRLSKVNLQQQLLSRQAPTTGNKEVLVTRLLELCSLEKARPAGITPGPGAQLSSMLTSLAEELTAANQDHDTLQQALHFSEASISNQRLNIDKLSSQLANLREASEVQQAKLQQLKEASALQKEDAEWMQQISSEIQALGTRTASLLQELLESDGVVAALRMQLQQRQQALEARESPSCALVAAGSISAQQDAFQLLSAGANRGGLPLEMPTSMQSDVAEQTACLEALWTASPGMHRSEPSQSELATVQRSRRSANAALLSAGRYLRAMQSPGCLVAAAALQTHSFIGQIFSKAEREIVYAVSAGVLGVILMTAMLS